MHKSFEWCKSLNFIDKIECSTLILFHRIDALSGKCRVSDYFIILARLNKLFVKINPFISVCTVLKHTNVSTSEK